MSKTFQITKRGIKTAAKDIVNLSANFTPGDVEVIILAHCQAQPAVPKPDKDMEDKLRAAGFYQVWRDPQTDLLYQSAEVALMKINTVGPAPQPAPKECTLNPNTCECGFCDWPKCNEE